MPLLDAGGQSLALLRRLRKLRFTTVADWGTIMVDAKVNSSAR